MINLRWYQQSAYDRIRAGWDAGYKFIVAVLPTGAGKTVLFSRITHDEQGHVAVIAHRQELVGQMSKALAREGVVHQIIAPRKTVKNIITEHLEEFGRSYYDPNAKVAAIGVNTLVNRADKLQQFCNRVTLWVIDEAHHVLESNQWGKAVELFPNARGLGVTATPERADGKGIGAGASGVFQHMVVGPTMRDLINEGFLTEYRIIAPPSNIDTSALRISKSTGDYNQNDVREAVAHSSLVVADDGKSRVIGDIVSHYLKFAAGKLGVTFVPDVDTATRVAEQYNSQGVPAAVVSAKTPDGERNMLLRKFRNRELLQLVNVDLFGEGFDLPAIEVVSMARPTASYGLYVQQFGRGLRLLDGKDRAIIIDHVGNVMRHGLPDAPREWSLLDRAKRSSGPSDAIPMRVCSNEACLSPFPRTLSECPECGTPIPPPAGRSAPEQVDGDLTELDPEILAQMRGEVARVDMPTTDAVVQYRAELQRKKVPKIGEMAHVKRFAAKHEAHQQAVSGLRELMAWWAGHHRAAGKRDEEIFKTFYFKFGVDWLSAQSLDADKMCALSERVMLDTGDV